MKLKNAHIAISLTFLLIAVAVSVVIWPDMSSAVKIAFFAFGYGSGVTAGAWVARRQQPAS